MSRVLKHIKYPLKYPGIVFRAASNYLRMFVLSQPRLRGVEFAINYGCQCNCVHCSAAFLKSSKDEPMTTQQIKQALEQIWRLGVMNINITGGEPIFHPDLEEIVRAAHPKSTVVSLATNGIALNAAVAKNLKKWGIKIVTISIDSADEKTHDRSRGYVGCYQKVMEATQHCQKEGIEVFWCTIMTPENVRNGDMLRLVALVKEKNITLTINLPCPVGRWWDQNLLLSPEARQLHRDLMKLSHVRWEGHSNYRREGCPAGIEKLYISPFGDVMPCPFIHISYGNLKDEPIDAIWKRILDVGPFNEIMDGCPVSENLEFAQRYIKPIYQQDEHPIPYARHPAVGKRSK